MSSPGALVSAYADRFTRLGGNILRVEAQTLRQNQRCWWVATEAGEFEAEAMVVALEPW